jgi:hypothetical protein
MVIWLITRSGANPVRLHPSKHGRQKREAGAYGLMRQAIQVVTVAIGEPQVLLIVASAAIVLVVIVRKWL